MGHRCAKIESLVAFISKNIFITRKRANFLQTIVRQQWQCQWRRRRRRRKCFKNIFENNFLAITLLAFAIFGIESAHSLRSV